MSKSIVNENEKDFAQGITVKKINKMKHQIVDAINEIPEYDKLYRLFEQAEMKMFLEDIDISQSKLNKTLEYSPLVRNRVTLMRLRR